MIYLDYHATTPTDTRVAEKVLTFMTDRFGNASSMDHLVGDRSLVAVNQAKQYIADLIHCYSKEIIFTSGATESLNLAIQGTVLHLEKQQKKPCIAISAVEHKAVFDICKTLEKQKRIELKIIPVDSQANLDLNAIKIACKAGLDLLCIMAANNEVGTIYPIEKIGKIAQKYQTPFLCDASQAVGKIPLNFQDWGITLLSISGHKLYAPQGIGALICKVDYPLEPLFYGGGHQQGFRPGTLNLPGIVGLGEACLLRDLEMEEDEKTIAIKRDYLQKKLQESIPNLVVNGNLNQRLAGNLHCSVPGIPNSAIIAHLRDRLAISTGSACSSGIVAPSPVLRAMNLPHPHIEGALRIGIGKFTTWEEINQSVEILVQSIQKIQTFLHFC